MGKSVDMTHKPSGLSVLFRHRWRVVFPQLLAFVFLANVVLANTPTFFYPLTNAGINAIATDPAGNTYLTGTTTGGASLVTTPGAFQPQFTATGQCMDSIGSPPCSDSFVVKLDPTGAVVFATYLGGNGIANAYAIAVDQQGNVYIAGTTAPPVNAANTFPVTAGAAFTTPINTWTGFITKLNPSGTQLVYSTLIPLGAPASLAIDSEGSAYVTGAGEIPATPGAFQPSPKSSANSSPGVVVKLNASGSALVYATYLSGSGQPSNSPGGSGGGDNPSSISVDAAGNAFITGWTYSVDFPVTPGAFMTASPGERSIFLSKLNPQGSALVYSTYLGPGGGGGGIYDPVTVKLDAQGTAYVAGSNVAGFPTTPGTPTADSGSFLTHVSADGSSLLYSTYLPAGFFQSAALDVDTAGNAVVAATASIADLPIGTGAFQTGYAGGTSDIYVVRFTPSGQISGSTYLGGSQVDSAQAIAFESNGSVVVAGGTTSPDFPGLAQAIDWQGANFVINVFPSLTVENAASFVATGIAPGEIVALRGYGIGPAAGVSATGPTTQLGGVQLFFDKIEAPLFYAQSGQVNAQVPWEIVGETSTTLQISVLGATPTNTGTPIAVTPSLPGIFYVNNSDGTPNSASNPAKPGDFIAIYCTGGGTMNSPGLTGQTWGLAPLSDLVLGASVFVGGTSARVLYAGSAPTLESGIFQIDAQLPSSLSGPASLYVTIGNASSAAVQIAIGAH